MDIRRRTGFTLIELLVVVAIIALLISILLPSLARARELAKRAVSRANARGIGQSCYIYANDNRERFPQHLWDGDTTSEPGVNYVTNIGLSSQITLNITAENRTASGGDVAVSRSLFLLIISGATSPKQFINPSSSDTADDLRNDQGASEKAANPGVDRFDFKGYDAFSYGYQHPYNGRANPDTDMDVRMALAADKGPWYEAAGSNDWAGSEVQTVDSKTKRVLEDQVDGSNLEDFLAASNEDWRPYNSPNHNGEGQSVLYVDGHVDFANKAIVGANQDNIYTPKFGDPAPPASGNQGGQDPAETLTYLQGQPIVAMDDQKFGPVTSTDTFIVP